MNCIRYSEMPNVHGANPHKVLSCLTSLCFRSIKELSYSYRQSDRYPLVTANYSGVESFKIALNIRTFKLCNIPHPDQPLFLLSTAILRGLSLVSLLTAKCVYSISYSNLPQWNMISKGINWIDVNITYLKTTNDQFIFKSAYVWMHVFLWHFIMLTHQTHWLFSSVLFISENVNIHKKK